MLNSISSSLSSPEVGSVSAGSKPQPSDHTFLVFLAWPAPILSHLLRTRYQRWSWGTNCEWQRCCYHLGNSRIYWLPPRNQGQRPAKFFRGDGETANDNPCLDTLWVTFETVQGGRYGVKGAGSTDVEAGVPSVLEMDIFILPAYRRVGKIVGGVCRVRKRP